MSALIMVSPQTIDEISNPTRVIQRLYDSYSGSDDSFPSVVTDHFSAIFFKPDDPDAVNQLPSLDLHYPPESYASGTLVRFSSMIQDTSSSPELYLAKLGDRKCGGWGMSSSQAVSVPGESPWHAEEASPYVPTSFPPHVPPRPHKFPIPEIPHIGVQVKIYDNASAQILRTTDVVTFIGILSSEPLSSELESSVEVPILHVICHKAAAPDIPHIPEPHNVRRELVDWLSKYALGDDDLAAEWLLLQLTSRVHSRAASLLPPSLTISNFPHPPQPDMLPIISHALSDLLPQYMVIPLSLELLNTKAFIPESRNEDLHSGYLQLPSGTTTLLTESGVQEGRVVEKGLINIRAMQEIMNSQTLEYAFPFSNFTFQTDISVIVLAEGRKSALFQTSLNVPLQCSTGNILYRSNDIHDFLPSEKLKSFRAYIASCRTVNGRVHVSEATSKYIQEDFVDQRRKDKTVTADDLIHLMKMARLFRSLRNLLVSDKWTLT
ncbi:putative alanine racemase-domain-containing protein [Scleroderma yunnanense]